MEAHSGGGSPNTTLCLEDWKIKDLPNSMYYIPNFIAGHEEDELLSQVNLAPLPRWRTLSRRRLQSLPSPLSASNVLIDAPLPEWLRKPIVRLKEMPVAAKGHSSSGKEYGETRHVFFNSPHQSPNHCLINEYLPGQGIMPHEDGPAYFPNTATVSLGSHAVLNVSKKVADRCTESTQNGEESKDGIASTTAWRILCEPRSLLITTGDAYVQTLHGIAEIEEDKILRLNAGQNEDMQTPLVANWNLLGDRREWVRTQGVKRRETRVSLTYRDVLKVKKIKGLGFARP